MTPSEIAEAISDADPRPFDAELRQQVWIRDEGRCVFCARRGAQCMHIIHRGAGGDDRANQVWNLILGCIACHDRFDLRAYPHIRLTDFDEQRLHLGSEVCLHPGQRACEVWVPFEPQSLYINPTLAAK